MKIGIIGLPQTGKKTLFQLLTNHKLSEKELVSSKPIKGIAQIRDPRFDRLAEIYKPAKEARAKIEMELLPKLDKESIVKGDIFKDIQDAEAICHVARAFKDDSVYHLSGSVDAKRDIEEINSELMLHDLLFVEKRIENVEKTGRRSIEEVSEVDKKLLGRLKSQLDANLPVRLLKFSQDEVKFLVNYPLLTNKKMIVALNVSEEGLADHGFLNELIKNYSAQDINIMQVSAKVEQEIAGLESETERKEFLSGLGIEEPAVDALTRVCMRALDLVSFFTVGPDEVRQWTVRAGSYAPKAAGAIHTDIEKGFIRAEVIKYNDLVSLGSEDKVKEAGKMYLKGKDYIVEDGDILNIRFSV